MSYQIRRAEQKDLHAIKDLIRLKIVNPYHFRLDWRRFVVAVDERGKLIGCGQIQPHFDGSYEIASLVVAEKGQPIGLVKGILRELISGAPSNVLWGIIDRDYIPFERYGVRQVRALSQMPLYFKCFFFLYPFIKPLFRNVYKNGFTLICYKKEDFAGLKIRKRGLSGTSD